MQDTTKILNRLKRYYGDIWGVLESQDLIEGVTALVMAYTQRADAKALKGLKTYGKYTPALLKFHNLGGLIADQPAGADSQLEKEREIYFLEKKKTGGGRAIGYTRSAEAVSDFRSHLNIRAIYKDAVGGSLELKKLLQQIKKSDIVYINSIYTDFTDQAEFIEFITQVLNKGAYIKSAKDTWIDSVTPVGYSTLQGMIQLHQFSQVAEARKQDQVLTAVENKGVKLQADADIITAIELYKQGEKTVKQICEQCNVHRSTLWRRLKALGIN